MIAHRGRYLSDAKLLAWRRRFFLALLLFPAFCFAAFRFTAFGFARPAVGRGRPTLWWRRIAAFHSVFRPAFLAVGPRRTSFGRRHSRLEPLAVWRTGLSLRLSLLVTAWPLVTPLWRALGFFLRSVVRGRGRFTARRSKFAWNSFALGWSSGSCQWRCFRAFRRRCGTRWLTTLAFASASLRLHRCKRRGCDCTR